MKISLFVWKNKEKKEDKHPDYKVSMTTSGEKGGFVSCGAGWIKSTKTGDKYISLQIDTEPKPWGKPEGLNSDEDNAKIKALKDAELKRVDMSTTTSTDDFNNW